ncbi:MAG: alpha/beta hydrolase [Archaeoglobaceae archaeon]|nr:alpha/beta hydrolase [Archaeoglobaceae archaeon]MCX8152604.1 alpha/beta hydrolase [Archaeoglobaceae archaeon]MDW8014114.1 alpha/beta hydrolase [Archaeoglobaceae archaeon]
MFIDKKIGRNYCRLSVERCVIICHGLPYEAGSVIQKGYYELAKNFSSKVASLIFDFSGTGLSEGNFNLLNWKEDLERISSEFEKVILLGYSIGGAIAISAASELKNVEKLIVVSTPCCLEFFNEENLKAIYLNATSKSLLSGIGSYENFKEKFIKDFMEIEPLKWISVISIPKLIVHGSRDQIVPLDHAEKLYSKARKPKTLLIAKDGDHFLRKREDVTGKIIDWLEGKFGEGIFFI